MYQNVGKKIMIMAQVLGWLELIAGVIVFIQSIPALYSGPEIYGWLSLVGGVVGFVFSWLMYGFGQLVDDVHAARANAQKPDKNADDELPSL